MQSHLKQTGEKTVRSQLKKTKHLNLETVLLSVNKHIMKM